MISKYAVIPESILSKVMRYHPNFINIQKLANLDEQRDIIEEDNDAQLKNAARQQNLEQISIVRKKVFNQPISDEITDAPQEERAATEPEPQVDAAYTLHAILHDPKVRIENDVIYDKNRMIPNSDLPTVLKYITAPKKTGRAPAGTTFILRSLANNPKFDAQKAHLRPFILQSILESKTPKDELVIINKF